MPKVSRTSCFTVALLASTSLLGCASEPPVYYRSDAGEPRKQARVHRQLGPAHSAESSALTDLRCREGKILAETERTRTTSNDRSVDLYLAGDIHYVPLNLSDTDNSRLAKAWIKTASERASSSPPSASLDAKRDLVKN